MADLATIYRELPALECQGKCTDSCGPINWGEYEARLVTKQTGRRPTFDARLRCTYLIADRCSVYELRPLICRLFGMVEKMKCPFGCVPERWVTDEEARVLFTKTRVIVGEYRDLEASPDAPAWIREAFARIAVGERARIERITQAPVAHVAEASGSKPEQGGFDSRSGHQCKECGYQSQDAGNGHTADYWHHMTTVHGQGPGVIDDDNYSGVMASHFGHGLKEFPPDE